MRILHFSDVHLPLQSGDVRFGSWIGKRGMGGLNLLLGRGRCFDDAASKVAALERFAREEGVELAINTGDSTALGTLGELHRAREALAPFRSLEHGLLTMPGNHDLYVWDSVSAYASQFRDWITTDLPDLAVIDGRWPFVRLLGEDVAVVGLNSARPNPLLWRSSGVIGRAQLEALARVLADVRLQDRVVFVTTHYAPRRADGTPDSPSHGLVDADRLLETCSVLERGALLHGHIHHRYLVQPEGMSVPTYCAGSATKDDHEGFWLFDVKGGAIHATPGTWKDGAYVLADERPTSIPA